MTLFEGSVNQQYIVQSTELPPEMERRLESLGLTRGTRVKMLNRKRNGAVLFMVRGTRLAVGKTVAKGIRVEEAADRHAGRT